VKRNENGEIVIGQQYQNHNSRPGPVYDGTGYSLMSKAIQAGPEKVKEVLRVSLSQRFRFAQQIGNNEKY
jgi:hypothetical protein